MCTEKRVHTVALNSRQDTIFCLPSPFPPLHLLPLALSLSYEEEQEELWCNYERYRTLVQNAFKGTSEEKCLKEMEIDDLYSETQKKTNREKSKYGCCVCDYIPSSAISTFPFTLHFSLSLSTSLSPLHLACLCAVSIKWAVFSFVR